MLKFTGTVEKVKGLPLILDHTLGFLRMARQKSTLHIRLEDGKSTKITADMHPAYFSSLKGHKVKLYVSDTPNNDPRHEWQTMWGDDIRLKGKSTDEKLYIDLVDLGKDPDYKPSLLQWPGKDLFKDFNPGDHMADHAMVPTLPEVFADLARPEEWPGWRSYTGDSEICFSKEEGKSLQKFEAGEKARQEKLAAQIDRIVADIESVAGLSDAIRKVAGAITRNNSFHHIFSNDQVSLIPSPGAKPISISDRKSLNSLAPIFANCAESNRGKAVQFRASPMRHYGRPGYIIAPVSLSQGAR